MVLLTETGPEMFWGVTLEQGKRYTQTVESSFHISMAALEPKAGSSDVVSVYINHSDSDFLLCSLKQGSLLQQTLDLGFVAGETVTLFISGKGRVHLTGYRVFDDDDQEDNYLDDFEDDSNLSDVSEDDEESEEEDLMPAAKKPKQALPPARANTAAAALDEVDDDEDDEDDEDYLEEDDDMNGLLDDEALSDEDDSEDDEEDSEEDDEEDSDEEELSDSEIKAVAEQVRQKMAAEEARSAKKKGKEANGVQGTPKQPKTSKQEKSGQKANNQQTPKSQQKTPKGDPKTPQQTPKSQQKKEPVKTPKQPSTPATTPKRKLPSGIVLEELKTGHGPEAKSNKMVHVYYTGKLNSGKVFDSNTSGRPFKFRLGKNEVIKGWEIGLQGMKVGGKRRLTIPPNLAYGSTSTGGIPANSTLHFDVELKAIS